MSLSFAFSPLCFIHLFLNSLFNLIFYHFKSRILTFLWSDIFLVSTSNRLIIFFSSSNFKWISLFSSSHRFSQAPTSFLNSLFSEVIFSSDSLNLSFHQIFLLKWLQFYLYLPPHIRPLHFMLQYLTLHSSIYFCAFYLWSYLGYLLLFLRLVSCLSLMAYLALSSCSTLPISNFIIRGLLRMQLRHPFLHLTSNSSTIITYITYNLLNRY